jgi:hypothetical protein
MLSLSLGHYTSFFPRRQQLSKLGRRRAKYYKGRGTGGIPFDLSREEIVKCDQAPMNKIVLAAHNYVYDIFPAPKESSDLAVRSFKQM